MTGYYAYFTGDEGQVTNRVIIIAANDQEAKERAKQLVDGQAVELWQERRKIATFAPEE
jgi:microcystin degradation protein MlrC